jgi:hypothetical protein
MAFHAAPPPTNYAFEPISSKASLAEGKEGRAGTPLPVAARTGGCALPAVTDAFTSTVEKDFQPAQSV